MKRGRRQGRLQTQTICCDTLVRSLYGDYENEELPLVFKSIYTYSRYDVKCLKLK